MKRGEKRAKGMKRGELKGWASKVIEEEWRAGIISCHHLHVFSELAFILVAILEQEGPLTAFHVPLILSAVSATTPSRKAPSIGSPSLVAVGVIDCRVLSMLQRQMVPSLPQRLSLW